jgi:chitinase
MIYWGQNQGGNAGSLASYCDSRYDVIAVAFLNNFPMPSGGNELNLANHCWETFSPALPHLLRCPAIGADIKTCQSRQKKLVLSMGGAIGEYGFNSKAQAEATADAIWNRYLGGSDPYRPFGDAKLDGVDLDIENRKPQFYLDFVRRMRALYATDPSRKYLMVAAPQCPFADVSLGPDGAGWDGTPLSNTPLGGGWFDIVAVQFYNNPV